MLPMARFRLLPDRASGEEPDQRFSLANERTFLAWTRTSLAFVGGGLAIVELAPRLSPQWVRYLVGVLLVGAGIAMALGSLLRWARAEDAMRAGDPLPPSRLPLLTAGIVGVAGLLAIVLLIVSGAP